MYTGGKDCAVLRWDVETGKKELHRSSGMSFCCHFLSCPFLRRLSLQCLILRVEVHDFRREGYQNPAAGGCGMCQPGCVTLWILSKLLFRQDVFPGGRNKFDCGGHFEKAVRGVAESPNP